MDKKRLKRYKDKGYRIGKNEKGEEEPIHLIIAREKYGEMPKGFHIHHIDGDKTNNKRSNLIAIHLKDHYKMHRWKKILIAERKNYYPNSKKKLSKEDKIQLEDTIKHIRKIIESN